MSALPKEIDAPRLLAVVAAVAREARPHVEPRVALDSSLEKELGLDSLARVELVLRLEREFAVSLPERALATAETPRDLMRFLLGAAGQAPRAADRSVASLAQSRDVRPPAQAQTLAEALEYHVERQPDRLTVLLYEEEKQTPLSYRSLYDGALGYAARLVQAGLSPGQMVAIMLPTGKEYLFSFYGTLLAGGVPVPLYPPARLTTIEDHMTRHVAILKSAGATLMITIPEAKALAWLLRAQVESLQGVLMPADLEGSGAGFAPVRGKRGDIGFLQYTSGSTGTPKGVVLTHENLLVNVQAMGAAVRADSSDVFVSWLPLYHDMGLIGGCFATMFLGFPVVLMSPLAFLARPSSWLRAIHRHRGTISGGPNFSYELCLRRITDEEMEGIDLSSWRFAFNGAEPVSPETLEAFSEKFSKWNFRKTSLSPVYGLAECTVGVAFTTPGEPWRMDQIDRERFSRTGEAVFSAAKENTIKVVGCGQVIAGHDLRVVDAAGLELPDRQEGLLQFRGPSATSGYYRNPSATRELFDGPWVNTGDRAYLAEGMVYITGREKDIIIRGGRNISPYELEQAVGDLAGVRRGCVAVFGSRDPASGTERMVVLAEMRERQANAARDDALRRMINELAVSLTGAPADDIVLAPPQTVPKTSSGKIRRTAAREFYERGPSAVKPQAVWLQFARLVLAGAAPQLRRSLRALGGLAFALRAYLVFAALFPFAFLGGMLASGRVSWSIGSAAARWFLRLAGIPVVLRGREHLGMAGTVVLAANHTSYLDVVVLLAVLPWRGYGFVAKSEFKRNLFMRLFLSGFGAQFVERFDVAKSAEDAGALAEMVKRGVSLIFFPEGTFRRAAGLLSFRTGAFQAAAQAGVPVVPIALRGVRSVLRDGTWYLRRAPVAVTIGAPLAPQGEDWAAAVHLRDAARAEILKYCGEPDAGG